jgi:hypothetical protein
MINHLDKPKTPHLEVIWLVIITGFLLLLDVATYNDFPAVWVDDISFSEPGINFAKYGDFTTTVWQFQPPNTFPIVNCPAYCQAVAVWQKLFGTTLFSVRIFNYTLISVAGILLWVILRRTRLVDSPLLRLVLIATVHLGYGISFSYRSSRPDILGLICLLLIILALGIRRPRMKDFCLLGLGAACVWVGLQVALYAWFACLAGWLILKKTGFRQLVVLSLGMGIGVGMLALFLASQGMLGHFLVSMSSVVGKRYAEVGSISLADSIWNIFTRGLGSYVQDFSVLPLIGGLLIMLPVAWPSLSVAGRRLACFGLTLFFVTPMLFNLVGHYTIYYSYMLFVPITVTFFATGSELQTVKTLSHRRWLTFGMIVTAGASITVGLPMRLAIASAYFNITPRSDIQQIIRNNLHSTDIVFSDFQVFFEVKQVAREVYTRNSSMELLTYNKPGNTFTEDEKRAFTVLVIPADSIDSYSRLFGGQWKAVTEPFGDTRDQTLLNRFPVIAAKLRSHLAQPQINRYPLQIFRRLSNNPDVETEASPDSSGP